MASQVVNCSAPDTGNMGRWAWAVLPVDPHPRYSQQRFWPSMEPLNNRNNGWSLCWTVGFVRPSP